VHTVVLRVTDTISQTDMVSNDSVQAGVDTPPTACFTWVDADGVGPGTSIDFDATCSMDDNGITLYEWDWDNDGTYDFSSASPTTSYDYGDTAVHTVVLRVTDTISQTDMVSNDTVQATAIFEIEDVNQSIQDRGFPIRNTTDGDWGAAQNFTPSVDILTRVSLYIRKFGLTEPFDLKIEIRENDPDGNLLITEIYSDDEIPDTWTWFEVDFDDLEITPGDDYFIVIPSAPGGTSNGFGYEWGYSYGDTYDSGSFWFTRDGGGWWRDLPTRYDFTFKTYGIIMD
jgi:hypothetical protein